MGVGVALIAIGVVATVAGSGHSVTTGAAATAASPRPSETASVKAAAGVGSSIVLAGERSGEQMTVTVTKVFRHPQPATQSDGARSGDRLFAVQFRLEDTGRAAYSDTPDNGAAVVDSSGQSYQSAISSVAECDSFPATENIAPGASGLGCVVFEVPTAAKIVEVQFTLDSGRRPQTGQWDIRFPAVTAAA
jgi:hypothetical protein